MSDVRTPRRTLRIHRAPAIGWDLSEGYADDPPGMTGRAALAARCLAHALAGDPVAGGWIRRHRLTEHGSRFSFWSPLSQVEGLTAAVSRIDPDPPDTVLDSLVAAQLVQAGGQLTDPVLTVFRAVETAAWGGSAEGRLGDEEGLASVRGAGFPAFLAHCVSAARLIDTSVPDTAPVASPAARTSWRGDVVMVDRPGEQCRLMLQLRLAPEIDEAACGAVLAQFLDGPEGWLYRRLRTEAGLVYGTSALTGNDAGRRTLIVGVSLLRERLPDVIDAMRRFVDDVDRGALPGDALGIAAVHVAEAVLTRLDEPFGALDEHRRRRYGHEPATVTAERAPGAAVRLAQASRLSREHRPAIAYVGTVDDAVPGLLEGLR